MSKEHSDQDTKLTPSKSIRLKLEASILEQTQRALEHYNKQNKKQYLKKTKQLYLEKKARMKESKINRDDSNSSHKKPKRKKKEIKRNESEYNIKRRSRLSRVSYQQQYEQKNSEEEILLNQISNHQSQLNNSKQLESILQNEIGTYELLKVHEYILDLQKSIDNYLDFQFVHRKKRTISRLEMFNFLKTTKFGLTCEKHFKYLLRYNPRLYKIVDQRIILKKLSEEEIQGRIAETRNRMSQIQIQELLI